MLISIRNRDIADTVSLIESDRWTHALSTEHASYPVAKVITDNLDDHAKAWGQRQSHTTLYSYFTLAEETSVDYVSLLGLNREQPSSANLASANLTSNQVRLTIDTYPKNNGLLPVVTASGFTTTNLTGVYGTLNQILNPPEDTLVGGYTPSALTAVSDSLDTEVILNFSNDLARPLKVGAGLQSFLIHVRDSVSISTLPTLTVTLRQNDVDISTLTSPTIEDTSEGYIFKYTWNASLLPNLTDTVGVKIHGTKAASSTVEYMAVAWRAEVTGLLFDTDWQDLESPNKVVWTPNLLLTTTTTYYVLIQFSDLSYLASGPFGSISYIRIGESLRIGRFAAGQALSMPLRSGANGGGFNLRKVGNNANSLSSSYGGQFRAIRSDMTRWQADLTFIPQSQSRVFGEIARFVEDVGNVLPALYIPNDGVTGTSVQHTNALWAVISSFEAPDLGLLDGSDTSTSPPYSQDDKRFDVRMSVIEAQAHLTRGD